MKKPFGLGGEVVVCGAVVALTVFGELDLAEPHAATSIASMPTAARHANLRYDAIGTTLALRRTRSKRPLRFRRILHTPDKTNVARYNTVSASGIALVSHVRPVPERGYLFGDDAQREGERLAALERTFDGLSQSTLLEVGVDAGWECWEVGAGRGSMARWLAGIVGPHGRVLATDLEDEWFDPGLAEITFLRHDVLLDPLPEGDFDLVHARFLLEHVAEPLTVIRRLRNALRRGGVLVLEDSAGLQIDVIPATPVFGRLAPAWERAGRTMGWNATYGLSLMQDLRSAGLAELRGREYRLLAPGGDAWTHVGSGLHRLRAELIEQGLTEQELNHALHSLADPANAITGPPVTVSWGHKMD